LFRLVDEQWRIGANCSVPDDIDDDLDLDTVHRSHGHGRHRPPCASGRTHASRRSGAASRRRHPGRFRPTDRDGTVGVAKPLRDIAHGLAPLGVAVLRFDK
jgi:hypothetical protein